MRRWTVALFALAAVSCGGKPQASPSTHAVVHLGEHVDAEGEATIALSGMSTLEIYLDGEERIVEIAAESEWTPPLPIRDELLEVTLDAPEQITIFVRGAPVPAARRERSLVWTDPAIVDDPSVVGLGRVMRAASGVHGGVMLDAWFRRFASTLHSERAGPAQLMDELAQTHGADPATWDLDALPFRVTAVHNRIDLGPRGGGCGEVRVSLASTHDTYAPLHLLFLFRQEPAADDIAPDGTIHCLGTARRWARLSSRDGKDFVDGARAHLDASLQHPHFLLAESVELTVSPWEWRQWAPMDGELDNPPLFQTVATPLLNQPGMLRDAFLAFVESNAAGLSDRTVEIPSDFRAASARVPPSVAAERLSLDGIDPAVLDAYPALAENIEIVGCPTCHTHNADFVHTLPDRTFSKFYDHELDARADYLDLLNDSAAAPTPPFGPMGPVTNPEM